VKRKIIAQKTAHFVTKIKSSEVKDEERKPTPPSHWEQEFLEQSDAHITAPKVRYRCPKCESLLVLKEGANGSFWGCEAYPVCNYTANNEMGKPVRAKRYLCPACQSPLRKKTFKDNVFWGCSSYPDCKVTVEDDNGVPSSTKKYPCRICGHYLVRKKSKNGYFWGCITYPKCTNTLNDDKGLPVLKKR
jgi:putative DNA topoisomerase